MRPLVPLSTAVDVRPSTCLSVLGSTGSIGRQTLEVAAEQGLRIAALTCWSDVATLARQIERFRPELVVTGTPEAAASLRERLRAQGTAAPRILAGDEGLAEAAAHPEADTVVGAVVGFAGLAPIVTAIDAGKKIALANKETLVAGGALVRRRLAASQSVILPIDSEHAAIWQCLLNRPDTACERLFLTCSGGPFRGADAATLAAARPTDALRHPTWSMGGKITIDSATLMNKGLEIIEACHLFDTVPDKITVVIHPQSVIHSMAAFADGSVLASLGFPDMRVPIHQALSFPELRPTSLPRRFDPFAADGASLTFQKPDETVFPSLRLAREALAEGGLMPLVYNAANEAAVAQFLDGRIPLTGIFAAVESALRDFRHLASMKDATLDDMMRCHNDVLDRVRAPA